MNDPDLIQVPNNNVTVSSVYYVPCYANGTLPTGKQARQIANGLNLNFTQWIG